MATIQTPAVGPHHVKVQLPYLARDDLYQTEKPYGADFSVDHFQGSKLTNHIFKEASVTIKDARGAGCFTLDKNGFCFLEAKTSLARSDASNDRTPAITHYLSEIERILHQKYPEYTRIEVMDFQVRKRAPGFPDAIGERVEFDQPAGMPHTDFSVAGAFMRMREAFPGQEKHYENASFDLINVWRVLHGPNDDWPLAVCDFESVELGNDIIDNDFLHQARVGENCLLHSSPRHQWYYLSGQTETELIIFRNTDSEGIRAKGFHSAFHNPRATGCEPRESIEVRLVAFR